MTFSPKQERILLFALLSVFALTVAYVYTVHFASPPKTAPLTYARGAVAGSPVRQGLSSRSAGADPLNVFLARRQEKYPGVIRDIFRMENPAPKAKPKPVLVSVPVVTTPTVTVPVKTPAEIAADLSRADLSKFRFLGYLTEKDNTLFLSKDGEFYMVKSGETILESYRIKETGKDYVVLLDTVTRVEVRVELSGDDPAPAAPVPPPAVMVPKAPQPRSR